MFTREPARPISAYGLSKRTAEEYSQWFRANHGLDVVTLRYGNVYGPRQDPAGDVGVIARFCSRALAAERPVVFGDGTQTRDYVYVGDIVSANVTAAWAPSLHHDTYNIGTGTEVSVLELVAAVAQAAGIAQAAFEPQFRPARAGEVTRSCLDVSRARRDLGLSAPTPIAVGLASTLNWMDGGLAGQRERRDERLAWTGSGSAGVIRRPCFSRPTPRQQLGAGHSIGVLCAHRGDQQLIAPVTRASVLSRSTTVAGEPTNWVSPGWPPPQFLLSPRLSGSIIGQTLLSCSFTPRARTR